MLLKNNSKFHKTTYSALISLFLMFIGSIQILAQMPKVVVPAQPQEYSENNTWQYILLFVLTLGLIGAVIWLINSKRNRRFANAADKNLKEGENSWDRNSLDADKELEWLRKNQGLVGKRKKKVPLKKSPLKPLPKNETLETKQNGNIASQFQEIPTKLAEKLAAKLPIFSITKVAFSRTFNPLPISNDQALMTAIEQTYDEMEEDESVREIALRILNAFKTKNSVEALSQIALYDLSANLRSRAVTILSDFDHESVFESVLLACADPTREVRAAAARALFRLSFDRADAWLRIAETEEEGRMIQAARAAIEGDLVERSLDRLTHEDKKIAFEAFALVVLLIKSSETKEVFSALEKHKDMNVRKAILHTIKITKNKKALEGLYSTLEKNNLPLEFQEEIDKTIEEIGFVTV